VKALTEPREVEGAIKSRADAKLTGELWTLAGHQEDAFVLSEGDKVRVREFVTESIQLITNAHNPCKWWQFGCKSSRRQDD
jgi:hypothetical protein